MTDRSPLKKAAAAGDLLTSLLRQWGMAEKIEECRAWLAWDEVVGPQIAAHARPIRVRDRVLEVRVDQPVWMQQLQLMKPQILAALNDRCDRPLLRDIFWRRGKVERVIDSEPAAPEWRAVTLSRVEEERIEAALAELKDPETRRGLQEVLRRQRCLQKAREGKPG